MRHQTDRRTIPPAPTCWQREAPCACLRVETSSTDAYLFPYQHLVTISLIHTEETETLRLLFSSHDVEITGRNLRALVLALQDFAVKRVRTVPERYHALQTGEDALVASIRIEEVK